jgi:hypothetical protein
MNPKKMSKYVSLATHKELAYLSLLFLLNKISYKLAFEVLLEAIKESKSD